MIDEVKKPVDPEAGGAARKAELQSIKQTATDCKELLVERQRLEQMIKDLRDNGQIEQTKDYSLNDWKSVVWYYNSTDYKFYEDSWNEEFED